MIHVRHCEYRIVGEAYQERENETSYRAWKIQSSNKFINAGKGRGKRCSCATCEDIHECLRKVYSTWAWHTSNTGFGNNCHTGTEMALSMCCMKSDWKPDWYSFGGDF